MRVLTMLRRAEKLELVVLYFIHAMAMAMWFVPLSAILHAHGLDQLRPYAFATSAVAAFISPLIFGAMADRHAAPVVVLRGLCLATGLAMILATTAIHRNWNPWVVLGLIQLYSFCTAPTFSITTAIVFSRLKNSQSEFGPIRAMATLGWMAGCWLISLLGADASTAAGYYGSIAWFAVAAFTLVLPNIPPPENKQRLTIRQRMGWDALSLLKNRDHRVVFITAALFNATIAALFPFTPPNLRELGFHNVSAIMSLAQTTELVAMFALAALLTRWRLKWIILLGLGFGVVRYTLCAMNSPFSLLVGISLHGAGYTLVLITSQIYLEQRIDPAWRGRAQSLQALMTSGVGNLIGYLGAGQWFVLCSPANFTNWPLFWGGIAVAVTGVLAYFLIAYHGRGVSPQKLPNASLPS